MPLFFLAFYLLACLGSSSRALIAARSGSASGTFLKRTVLYPALFSIASRAVSSASFPLWLASSSSTTHTVLNPFVHSTKSITFLLKVFRLLCAFAVSSADIATWGITTRSGKVSVSRKNIACSRSVSGFLARGFSRAPLLPFNTAAAITAMTPISRIGATCPSRFPIAIFYSVPLWC